METVSKTYEPGLKDPGGALEYGANLTMDLVTTWRALVKAYETASAAGKKVWFAVVHRTFPEATYYTGAPSPLGLNEAAVSSMLETTLFITPSSSPEMAAKPTDFVPPAEGDAASGQSDEGTPIMRTTTKKTGGEVGV